VASANPTTTFQTQRTRAPHGLNTFELPVSIVIPGDVAELADAKGISEAR